MAQKVANNDAIPSTALWAVCAVTFLASIGTGVVWNGVPFIAEHDYGFEKRDTMMLYIVMGFTYVLGAFGAGRLLRSLQMVFSARSALGVILALETLICTGPYFVRANWMLWIVAGAISMLSSWLWPIIESYLTSGRHGPRMRSAIGWWNLSWTSAVAVGLVLMKPMMQVEPATLDLAGVSLRLEPRLAIVALGACHALALLPLMWFHRWPGEHHLEQATLSIGPEYPWLLRAARLLLPLSYVLNSAMTPLLPYHMNNLDVAKEWQTTAASTWMWVRIVAIVVMWRVGFWHGRWGTLLLGGLAMAAGFGLAVAGLSIPLLLVGLAVFGAGMGIVYYATLYYSMTVGRAEVDAAGAFEGLIGVGYTVGPATGLLGITAASAAQRIGWQIWDGAAVVAAVWCLVGVGGLGALRLYRQARRLRPPLSDTQPLPR